MDRVRARPPARLAGRRLDEVRDLLGGDGPGDRALLPPADVVIWDPAMKKTIRDQDEFSSAKYSTYAGRQVTGFPKITIRRGEVVYENGKVIGKPGTGKFIPQGRFQRPRLRETSNFD
jgi:N-acyl-D-aspartate/D-glutamate deacylase